MRWLSHGTSRGVWSIRQQVGVAGSRKKRTSVRIWGNTFDVTKPVPRSQADRASVKCSGQTESDPTYITSAANLFISPYLLLQWQTLLKGNSRFLKPHSLRLRHAQQLQGCVRHCEWAWLCVKKTQCLCKSLKVHVCSRVQFVHATPCEFGYANACVT